MIVIDLESRSRADIRKVGAYHYAMHPSTEILCVAWGKLGQGKVNLWRQGDPLPKFGRGQRFIAHNAAFEMVMFEHLWGWAYDPTKWVDTAAMAAAANIPRHLEGACTTLKLDHLKDTSGKELINALCVPQRDGRFQENATLYRQLCDYCIADVEAERDLFERLYELTETEQRVWQLDATINRRGVPVDTEAVDGAVQIIDKVIQGMDIEVAEITDGHLQSMNSRKQVMEFFEMKGHRLANFDKVALRQVKDSLPPDLRRLVEIRQQTGMASVKKYKTLQTVLDGGDRLHGSLMYHGAATGRWAGRMFQPQNLPRPTVKDADKAADLFYHASPDVLSLYGEPLEVLSSGLRSIIKATPGHRLIVADFSQIEARVLPWLAGQQDVLDVFAKGEDVYKHAAGQIYTCTPEQVDDEQRFVGKVATLALGYAGGARAFAGMASVYGVDIDDERADEIKRAWRQRNQHIVNLWYGYEDAAKLVIENPETPHVIGRCTFNNADDGWMTIKLPSGRRLSYFHPEVVPSINDEGVKSEGRTAVQYLGQNSQTRGFAVINTYGGKLAENITQAVARDLMAEAMLRLEAAGYPIVMTVHDEVIAEVPDGFGSVDHFVRVMCEPPSWAEGLPIDAGGFETQRYRK